MNLVHLSIHGRFQRWRKNPGSWSAKSARNHNSYFFLSFVKSTKNEVSLWRTAWEKLSVGCSNNLLCWNHSVSDGNKNAIVIPRRAEQSRRAESRILKSYFFLKIWPSWYWFINPQPLSLWRLRMVVIFACPFFPKSYIMNSCCGPSRFQILGGPKVEKPDQPEWAFSDFRGAGNIFLTKMVRANEQQGGGLSNQPGRFWQNHWNALDVNKQRGSCPCWIWRWAFWRNTTK